MVADWLLNPYVQYVLAALLTLATLYGVGLLTAHVLGRRLLAFMERQLERLPVVQSIYGATRRFLNSLQKPPMSTQRVVLIAFPSPEMKAIGFATRVMCDPGQVVNWQRYMPLPNPTRATLRSCCSTTSCKRIGGEEAMTFMTGTTAGRTAILRQSPRGGKTPAT